MPPQTIGMHEPRASRRQPPPFQIARDHRGALARRPTRPRHAHADRARHRPAPRLACRAPRQRWAPARGRLGRMGLGTDGPVAERARRASGRAAVLHHRRPHPRPAVVGRRRPPEFRLVAAKAGVRRRFAPHQLRHAHALELAREGVPLNIIQRQLGHTNLGKTSIICRGSIPRRSFPRCARGARP
jgi:integrase